MESVLDIVSEENGTIRKRIAALEAELREARAARDDAREQASDFSMIIDKLRAERDRLAAECERLLDTQDEVLVCIAHNDKLIERIDAANVVMTAQTTTIENLESTLAAARRESAEALAEWCEDQRPSFQAQSLHGEIVAMCDLVARFYAALRGGEEG